MTAAKVRNRGDEPLIRFLTKYGQSFDWVFLGDPKTMIRVLSEREWAASFEDMVRDVTAKRLH